MRRRDRQEQQDADFTEFVAARSAQLYRSAYLLTTSPTAAEDLLQTTLAKAYAAWPRVRSAEDPVSYAHGILLKSFLSEKRRRSSRELPMADPTGDRPPAAEDADPADRIALMAALRRLGGVDRAVVVLRYWEDHSVADTARLLGVSEAAVKNRSLRALRTLRALLGEPPEPSEQLVTAAAAAPTTARTTAPTTAPTIRRTR